MMKTFAKILILISSLTIGSVYAVTIKDCPKVKEIDADIEAVAIDFDAAQQQTVLAYLESLHYYHFKKMPLNDDFSKKLLDRYLDYLDGRKIYFLQSDIDSFEKSYKTTLDNLLLQKDLSPLKTMYEIFRERLINRLTHSISLLENPKHSFKYDATAKVAIDPDLFQWSKNNAENLELWNKLVALDIVNLQLNGDDDGKAREKIVRRYKNKLVSIKRYDANDVLSGYLNAIGHLYDPHTSYFSPVQSDNFQIGISLSLEGIGASLTTKDNIVEVASIVLGSPAFKSGELQEGDKIIGVAEGDNCDFIDIVGMPLREVVQYIRGKKGSLVRLEVVAAESKDLSQKKVISLIRDKIDLKDNAAKKQLLQYQENGETVSIGVVDLPSFYVDVRAQSRGEKDYRSTTRDVRNLLFEMIDEANGLDGIIIDLRQNGGGSLAEVIALSDLFLAPGPIVQIKHARYRRANNKIARGRPVFDQPLLVLIDRRSASASEIFAAVIQDYRRGVIVGGQSYGKGSVQSIRGLPVGQAKITESKYYRVSGGSTQQKGVVPDIAFPNRFDNEKIGESSLDNSLPWDTINQLGYPVYDLDDYLPSLRINYQKRLLKDINLGYLNNLIVLDKQKQQQKYISIDLDTRKQEQEHWEKKYLDIENDWRKLKGYPPKQPKTTAKDVATAESKVAEPKASDKKAEAAQAESAEDAEQVEKFEAPDILLEEASRVLRDFLDLRQASIN